MAGEWLRVLAPPASPVQIHVGSGGEKQSLSCQPQCPLGGSFVIGAAISVLPTGVLRGGVLQTDVVPNNSIPRNLYVRIYDWKPTTVW